MRRARGGVGPRPDRQAMGGQHQPGHGVLGASGRAVGAETEEGGGR
jgi:hypothetical protein